MQKLRLLPWLLISRLSCRSCVCSLRLLRCRRWSERVTDLRLRWMLHGLCRAAPRSIVVWTAFPLPTGCKALLLFEADRRVSRNSFERIRQLAVIAASICSGCPCRHWRRTLSVRQLPRLGARAPRSWELPRSSQACVAMRRVVAALRALTHMHASQVCRYQNIGRLETFRPKRRIPFC